VLFLVSMVLAFPDTAPGVVLPAQVVVQGLSGAETTGRWPNHRGALLFFLDRECPVSNGYAPEMARLAQLARNGKLAVLGIYSDQSITIQEAIQHAKEYALGFDVVVDKAQSLATASGVVIVPQAVIADSKGHTVYRGRINDLYSPDGTRRLMATRHDLRNALEAFMANKPVLAAGGEPFGCPLATPTNSTNPRK
jgi:peroxiredoxin